MKNRFLIPIIYIFLLAACTPPTATSTMMTTEEVALLPTEIPRDIPTETPTSEPTETATPTPLPEGKDITVTNNNDSGPGSLRQALQDAQPYDTILFDPAIFPPGALRSTRLLLRDYPILIRFSENCSSQ
jgi:hypothetical protein